MSKGNFERKLTTYSTRRREGLCANTHTQWDEVLQVVHLSNRYSHLSPVLKQGSALYFHSRSPNTLLETSYLNFPTTRTDIRNEKIPGL